MCTVCVVVPATDPYDALAAHTKHFLMYLLFYHIQKQHRCISSPHTLRSTATGHKNHTNDTAVLSTSHPCMHVLAGTRKCLTDCTEAFDCQGWHSELLPSEAPTIRKLLQHPEHAGNTPGGVAAHSLTILAPKTTSAPSCMMLGSTE